MENCPVTRLLVETLSVCVCVCVCVCTYVCVTECASVCARVLVCVVFKILLYTEHTKKRDDTFEIELQNNLLI